MVKYKFKNKAVRLRQKGYSYSEILTEIPVAKSTLSLWLRSVGLSKQQRQRLSRKKLAAARRGGSVKRQQRINITEQIHKEAEKDIKNISSKELWLIGVILYWAEGSKEKDNSHGVGVIFSNSDPLMIKLFTYWLVTICKIDKKRISIEIYIHENFKKNINKTINFWLKNTNFTKKQFKNVYYKKHSSKTEYKSKTHHGLARVKVQASSSLNRKISGWIIGINKYYSGIV